MLRYISPCIQYRTSPWNTVPYIKGESFLLSQIYLEIFLRHIWRHVSMVTLIQSNGYEDFLSKLDIRYQVKETDLLI